MGDLRAGGADGPDGGDGADPAAADAASGGTGGAGADRDGLGRRARRRAKRATVVTHRWLSLVLGLLLVVVTTTGAAVVYSPEWTRWTNSAAFHVTASTHPISVTRAMQVVAHAHPGFGAGSVNVYSGLDEVYAADDDKHPGFYGVDPGTGRITGYVDPDRGVMAFMEQIHECFFTCDDLPGYLAFLDHPMPTLGMAWLKDVTVASFIIGVLGLLLVLLAVSGIWLWWPSLRRFGSGFAVRFRRGRYRRDGDLHKVIGIVAVPFLLMWGFTGASFELHWVSTAWYAVTGGQQQPTVTFTSRKAPAHTPDITPAQALAAARRVAGRGAVVANLFAPEPGDATGAYEIFFSRGFDPYRYGSYPGQLEVDVDRHDARRTHVDDLGTAPTLSNKLLDAWGPSVFHYGQAFNPWVRTIWFCFGLTPLILAVTGLSTWLVRRKTKRRRRRATAAVPAVP